MADYYNLGDRNFVLRNGLNLPSVGLGTCRIRNIDALYWAIDTALQVGYRLFDTAALYGNEQEIGDTFRQLLPRHGLLREDIFVTTKLSPADHGTGFVERALDRSLENLGFDYVDLYLMNFPGAAKISPDDLRNKVLRHESWMEMDNIYQQGKAHAIGVSNFTINHIQDIVDLNISMPLLNQVEWHPYYFQPEMLKYCNDNGICLQAYSSFGGSSIGQNELLEEPILDAIAREHNITPHQVLLLWALQKDVAVIPKSVTPYYIEKNYELNARLNPEDITAIDALNTNHKYGWDPTLIP